MTYQNPAVYDFQDRPALETEQIEITPQMIEAGVSEIVCYSDEVEGADCAVRRIYAAMEAERRAAAKAGLGH